MSQVKSHYPRLEEVYDIIPHFSEKVHRVRMKRFHLQSASLTIFFRYQEYTEVIVFLSYIKSAFLSLPLKFWSSCPLFF